MLTVDGYCMACNFYFLCIIVPGFGILFLTHPFINLHFHIFCSKFSSYLPLIKRDHRCTYTCSLLTPLSSGTNWISVFTITSEDGSIQFKKGYAFKFCNP
jgi:hypothetical protein